MKIKISKSPIFVITFIAMIIAMEFLSIFNIPGFDKNANAVLIVNIVALLLFFNSIVNNYVYNTLKPYRNYTNVFFIILTAAIVAITLYSYNKYGQSLQNYYTCFREFVYFFMAIPLIFVFTKQNGYEYFMKALLVVTIIYVALCFVNSFHYSLRGYLLFEHLQFGLRNDRLRCQAPYSLVVMIPYVFNKIIDEKLKKDKAKWIGILAFFVCFMLYVCMTRMLNTAFYVFLATSIIFIPKNANLRRTILIIYALVFIVLLATGQLSTVWTYLQERDNNLTDSAQARVNSINYFKMYADSNPLFSMGFVSPTNDYYSEIFFGKMRSYFFDDIGIMNIYLHYGIVGSIPFVVFILRVIYLVIKIYFINKSSNKNFFLGMLIFIAVPQVSLCMFDGQRIMGAVLMWALCEYEAYSSSTKAVNKRKPRVKIERHKIIIN